MRDSQAKQTREQEMAREVSIAEGYQPQIGSRPVDGNQLRSEVLQLTNQGFDMRPEQVEMTQNIINELQENNRVQVRAACGMGKTLVQETTIMEYDRRLQEERDRSGTYVVLLPSIKLAQQMKQSYLKHGVLDLDEDSVFSVHCDPTDPADEPVNQADLQRFMEEERDGPKVIFVVNSEASVSKVIGAQRESGSEVDMTIFDEAHKYVVGKGTSRLNGTLFNSPDNVTLNSNTRVFMTATPVARDRYGARGLPSKKRSAQETIDEYVSTVRTHGGKITDKAKAKELVIDMSDDYAFGNMVSNHSLRTAVEKGYLVRPKPYASMVQVASLPGQVLSRNTQVTADGAVLSGEGGGMSLGSYQNVSSLYDHLSSDDSYSVGGRSNTLSFGNSVNECKEVSANWREVGLSMSTEMYGGRPMPLAVANQLAHDPSSEYRKAARVRLLAEHASVLSTSSTHSASQKAAALSHFDEKGDSAPNGRLKDCSCGQPGRWCPCARVVANYDMYAEGVDVPAVDTVVLDRPTESSESMIVQAVGRSSRRFTNALGRAKRNGSVVIPMTYDSEGRLANPEEVSISYGAVDKMWDDRGEEFYHQVQRDDHYSLPVTSETLGGMEGGAYTTRDMYSFYFTEGIDEGEPHQRIAAAQLMQNAFDKVFQDHRSDLGLPKLKLPFEEKYQVVMQRVRARAYRQGGPRGKIDAIQILASANPDPYHMRRYGEIAKLAGNSTTNRQQHLEGHPELHDARRQSGVVASSIKGTEEALILMRECGIIR